MAVGQSRIIRVSGIYLEDQKPSPEVRNGVLHGVIGVAESSAGIGFAVASSREAEIDRWSDGQFECEDFRVSTGK